MIGGGIISARRRYTDYYALRLNGTSQQIYVTNPTFQTYVNGAIRFRVRFPVVLAANGTIPIFTFSSAVAGNNSLLVVALRYNAGYAVAGNYIDVLYKSTNGGTIYIKSGKTNISANTVYEVVVTSDGKIYLNGVEETYQKWTPSYGYWNAGFFGSISGTSHDMTWGSNRNNGGVTTNYGRIDINEMCVFNAVPTSTEVTEMYAGGGTLDPLFYSAPLLAKLTDVHDMEQRLTPFVGANTYTPLGTGTPNYIAFP